MKRCINFTQLAVLLSLLFTVGSGIAETQDENIKGRINFDFSDVSEAIIEVNVSSKLFTLLTKSVEHEPEIGQLVAMIKGYMFGDTRMARILIRCFVTMRTN